MATSGSKSVTVTSNHTLRFEWSLQNQSITDNTSDIYWELYVDTDAYGAISLGGSQAWSVTIDGQTKSGADSGGFSKNSHKLLGSGTVTVTHSSDGSKTFSYSFEKLFGFTWGGTYRGTYTGSGNGTLTTIPRTSDLSVSNGTLGESQTIIADRKSSSFTHSLRWSTNGFSGTLAEKSSATSWNYTPSLEIANDAPNGTSISMTFTLETYSGSTLIGSKSKTVTMSIPASVVPLCDVQVSDRTTSFEELGKFLQGKSSLHIKVTASGIYGSTISSYKVTVDGQTYNQAEFDTAVLQGYGDMKVVVVVTDSRNRTKTLEYPIEVQSYNYPRITLLTVIRCLQDGTENISGLYAKVTYSFTVSSVSTGIPKLKYKRTIDSSYTVINLPSGQSADKATQIFPADDGYAYDIELEITDSYGTADRRTNLSTGYALYHVPKSGKGITFGGVATGNGFDVMMTAMFHKGLSFLCEELASGDCNRMKVSGTYFIGIYGKNRPASNTVGWLTVYGVADKSYCYQEYRTVNGQYWIRYLVDGEWTSWTNIISA